jgi:hypothetical protein
MKRNSSMLMVLAFILIFVLGCMKKHELPDIFVDNFMQSCLENTRGIAGAEEYCACVLYEIEKNITLDEIMGEGGGMEKDGQFPDQFKVVMDEAIAKCLHHVKQPPGDPQALLFPSQKSR